MLLQNVNLQMAREEYELNGQQGLDELLSVFAGDEIQACAHTFLPCKDNGYFFWFLRMSAHVREHLCEACPRGCVVRCGRELARSRTGARV